MSVIGYQMGWHPDPAAQAVANSYRWATVTAAAPLTIVLDGEALPLALVPDCLVDPLSLAVGDRVWVQLYGRRVIIHGAQGGGLGYPRLLPNETVAQMLPNGSSATSSGAYVDWPSANPGPLSVTHVKRFTSSRLVLHIGVTDFMGIGGLAVYGLRYDGSNHFDIISAYHNVGASHVSWNQWMYGPALAAGSHTFTLTVRTNGVQVECDLNHNMSISIREVP